MGLGGAQTIVNQLLDRWSSDNIQLLCFSLRRSNNFSSYNESLFVSSNYESKYNLSSFLELKNFIIKNDIKILHLHLPKSVLFGVLIKILYFENIRIIVHEHGDIFQNKLLYNLFLRQFQNKIDLFIAVSGATRKKLIKKAGIDENKIKVLYNFIDQNYFNNNELSNYSKVAERQFINLTSDDFVIGFAGRLNKIKGCDILIKSMSHIDIRGLKIVIAGDGIERKNLEELSENLNIRDNIIFLGYIKNIRGFYKIIDVLVVSSRSESFGLSIVEAQSMGIPVIATNIEGLNEIVLDKETGLLFKSGDEEDLAKKIELIYTDENLRTELTKKGLENIKKYSLKNYITNLEGIYNGLF